jgi:hypothetical protein
VDEGDWEDAIGGGGGGVEVCEESFRALVGGEKRSCCMTLKTMLWQLHPMCAKEPLHEGSVAMMTLPIP